MGEIITALAAFVPAIFAHILTHFFEKYFEGLPEGEEDA